MVCLLELPVEILAAAPLPGIHAKAVVLSCRLLNRIFTPQLYRAVCFAKDAGDQVESGLGTDTINLDPASEGFVILKNPHAIHLWCHVLCASADRQRDTRRLWLLSDVTLGDQSREVSPGLGSGCQLNLCRCYDWTVLARLPSLEEAVFSAFWMSYVVAVRGRLPMLRTLQSITTRRGHVLYVGDPWTFRSDWDVLDLLDLTAQPKLREVIVHDCCVLGPEDTMLESSRPSVSGVERLMFNGVEIQPRALRVMRSLFPHLTTFHWRRVPGLCAWRHGDGVGTPVEELHHFLFRLQGTLRDLHLDLQKRRAHDWQCRHRIRDRHLLPTLEFLMHVTVLKIAPELLLGRRWCRRHSNGDRSPQVRSDMLGGKLPPALRHLHLFVDARHMQHDPEYGPGLIRGILLRRERLVALTEIVVEDYMGDGYGGDWCSWCPQHEAVRVQTQLGVEIERCRGIGIQLTHQSRRGQA